jgi:hypothetical protein
MRKIIIPAIAALSLTGCVGIWTDRCQNMGFTPGTSGFGQCMLQQQVVMQRALNSFAASSRSWGTTSSSVHVYLHEGDE